MASRLIIECVWQSYSVLYYGQSSLGTQCGINLVDGYDMIVAMNWYYATAHYDAIYMSSANITQHEWTQYGPLWREIDQCGLYYLYGDMSMNDGNWGVATSCLHNIWRMVISPSSHYFILI